MCVIFTGETALSLYERNPGLAALPRCLLPDEGRCSIEEALCAANELALGELPHILVARKELRRYSGGRVRCHLFEADFQTPQFICYQGIYLVSPELCYVQLARGRSFEELLRLGCMFCGDYRPSAVRFKEGDKPLTSKKKLEEYVDCFAGRWELKGFAAIRRVLPYLFDNSHSARESQLAIMLSLPCRMGGYGLSKPLLNARLKNSLREADLLWLENKLVVEYESNQHHATVESLGKDSTRRTEIELLGFRVITATNEQVTNYRLMDDLAHLIAKCLGHRLRDSTTIIEKRRKLHKALFSPVSWM